MAEGSLKQKTLKGILWTTCERLGTQAVQLVISIVLARLVLPSQFGLIAMLAIFISLSQLFIDSGFTNALIQKTSRTQVDCSTIFFFNLFMSVGCYVVLFFAAPLIADFYNLPELTVILRILALQLPLGAGYSVHTTLFTAEMRFNVLSKYKIACQMLAGLIAICMAWYGFQVWALVCYALALALLTNVFIWIKSPWRPEWVFSMYSLKGLWKFGKKLLASSLLDQTYTNMQGLLIGKFYTPASLAFFTRAQLFRDFSTRIPTEVVQQVTYPALLKLKQKGGVSVIDSYRHLITLASFLVFPLAAGMAAVSVPLVNVLLTDRWIYTASLLPVLCLAGIWYPIHAININILLVNGRSDLFLRLEIWKKIVGIGLIAITLFISIEAVCWSFVLSSVICLFINTHYSRKLYGYGLLRQFRDMGAPLLLSAIMYTVVFVICRHLGDGPVSLLTGAIAGIVIYFGAAVMFKIKALCELKKLLCSLRKNL